WVEHDPMEILTSQMACAVEALGKAGARPRDVAAIGITNQRETTIVWDRESGLPVHNAIVWQDRRTTPMCERLRAAGAGKLLQRSTGLLPDPYFSATKLAWILDHVPGARKRAERGKLAFGTVDSWLVWKLTSRRRHVTDASNASRTLLFNIHTGEWDPELLSLFRIPASMLPEVRPSSEIYGQASSALDVVKAPIAGIAGDQQAALFGQMCLAPGRSKCTYGTGCFLLQNTGSHALPSKNKLLTTVAWKLGGRLTYAQEGSVFIGGAAVQWLRDGLGLVRTSSEVDALALTAKDSGGLFLVPAFAGLGAPHWDPYARGLLIGITRETTAAHLARAVLEGIAFQVADLIDALQADTGRRLRELRVDGGLCRSEPLMQFQADILGIPVVRPAVIETTALGAAYLAGLAVGFWKTPRTLARLEAGKVERVFEPRMPRSRVEELRARWSQALERAKGWERPGGAGSKRGKAARGSRS
ncbi:MAG TPA: glycerol kinase GlpK, partial [Candidatus Acidoferrales bacterium]|nr:glycerol kinase GlpK [Candidatus Acidoferrales bacterium]